MEVVASISIAVMVMPSLGVQGTIVRPGSAKTHQQQRTDKEPQVNPNASQEKIHTNILIIKIDLIFSQWRQNLPHE